MPTAEEDRATSSYGGGGFGGKFPKKPSRRQPTPYERPRTAYRGIATSSSTDTTGWFTKLVVDPASKLISYGANRFFASVLRKRLPPPPPPPEVNSDTIERGHGAISKTQESGQEPSGGITSMPIDNSPGNGIHELEQLLKQKTFSRLEIAHLTELLRSRAVEVSLRDDGQQDEESTRHEQLPSIPIEENKNKGVKASADISARPLNSKILGDDTTIPADLAKAYMGRNPATTSSSALQRWTQGGMDDVGLFRNRPVIPQTSALSLPKKTSVGLASPQNGFLTPRSRGRSAIYNMARTPYFRVHPTSVFKESRNDVTSNTRASIPSSTLPAENDENVELQPKALKRRISVLEDEVGSIGPIRRIRQKPNLLTPKVQHTNGLGIDSRTKQKHQLIDEPSYNVMQTVGETESENVPSTSHAHIPSKSSEVAAKIFLHLEKLTPKEKSSESKLVVIPEKSPRKMTPGMLSDQAFRSMEDADSSKFLTGGPHDNKLGDSSIPISPNSHDCSFQKPRNFEENGPKESVAPTDVWSCDRNNDSAVSLAATPTTITTQVENGATQPSKKKFAFRMSAPEDFVEQDDEVHFNEPASVLAPEKVATVEDPLTDKKHAPAEVPKLVKTAISASKDATVTPSQLVVVPYSSAPAFEKPVESTTPSLFTFSSKSVEKVPSLPTEYGTMAEPKVDNSNSLVDVSVSSGLEGKIPESDKSGHVNLQASDTKDRSDTVPHAKEPHVTSFSPVSIVAAASDGTTEISEGGTLAFTSSSSTSTVNPTSTALSESVFGAVGNPSNLAGSLFKFGTPADPAVLVPKISEISHTRTKVDINSSSDSLSVLNSSGVAPDAAKPESNMSGLDSSVSQPTVNLQGSVFGNAPKPIVFGTGTVSQGTTLLPDSSASSAGTTSQGMSVLSVSSAPSLFSDNNIRSSGPLSNPQVISPSNTFGFSSAASSSDTNTTALPGSEAASSVFRFGASPISEGTGVTSTGASTPTIFSFGLSSSFASSGAGANTSSSLPKFNFGGSSLASVSGTASSFSSGTSGMFNFGGASTSSGVPSRSPNTGAIVLSSSVPSAAPAIFGSNFASASPSTGFSFGASSSASASSTSFTPIKNTSAVMPFNSSAGASSSPFFSFTSGSISASSSQALPSNYNNNTQPVFGNLSASGFTPSSGNNDQMNAEDSMAEDPVQSSSTAPAAGVFGQSLSSTPPAAGIFGQPSSVTPSGFTFGSTVPAQPPQPFMFGNQQSQVPMQNPSPFQASSSLDFNGGSSFSLGSGGGGDKSGRRIVKINRSKNRKR